MAEADNPSWRHHYVPQFYLKRWATEPDKALWCYERLPIGKLVERRVVPKQTGFGDDLYVYRHAFPVFDQEPTDIIEKRFFQDIDDKAAKALATLIAGRALDAEGREAWALFVCSMLHRGAQELAERDALAPNLVAETLNKMRRLSKTPASAASMEETLSRIDVEALATNSVRESMIREIKKPEHIEYLKGCRWAVVPIGSEQPLLTADEPLIINSGQSKRPIETIMCALSPEHLFLLWNEKLWDFGEGNDFLESTTTALRLHNWVHCHGKARYLYSRDKLTDTPQAALRTAVERRFGLPLVLPDGG